MAFGGIDTIANMVLGINSGPASRGLAAWTGSAHNAGRATEHFERTTKNLTASLGVLGGYFGVRQLVEYADTWTLINARVSLVTDTQEEAMAVQQRLYEIAQKSRNTLAATSVLYTRVALNADQLGRSHEELLGVVSAVNSAMLLSGATGVESAQAMRQFAQALGSGRVQGDEFRTMMEAMPMVARAIADEMGVAMGDLYRLSKKGQIDVQTVIDALLKKQEELEKRSQDMPWTVGQAFEFFSNAVTRIIGIVNMAAGASAKFAEFLKYLGEQMHVIVAVLGAAIIGFASYRAAVIAGTMVMMGLQLWTQKTVIWTGVLTAAKTIQAFLSLARTIRTAADAMALFSMVSKGVAGAVAAIIGVAGAYLGYKMLIDKITAATKEWEEAQADLAKKLGENTQVDYDQIDAEEKLARKREDLLRLAAQQVVLSGREGDAQERLQIQFDAVNKRIEARREYTGKMLQSMLAAIDTEEEWLLVAQRVESQLERSNEVIEEHAKLLDTFAGNLQRSMADVFAKVMNDGIKNFRDLFDAIKQMFFRMLAEMAAASFMEEFGDDLKKVLRGAFSKATEEAAEAMRRAAAAKQESEGYMGPASEPGRQLPMALDEDISNEKINRNAQILAKYLGPAIAGYGIGQVIGREAGNVQSGTIGGGFGGMATGFMMGGVTGAVIGGLTGALGGLLGATEEQKKEMEAHREVLRTNNQALDKLRDQLAGEPFRWAEDAKALMARANTLHDVMDSVGKGVIKSGRVFDDLNDLADRLGMTYDGTRESMEQLREGLRLTLRTLTEFTNTVADATLRQRARNRLYDIEETPRQQLQDTFDILNQLAPELMRQMGLTNLNLDTQVGRDVLLEGLRGIFEMIDAGQLNYELLGAFEDKGQLLDAILRVVDGLDAFAEQLYNVTTDFPRAMDIIYYEQKHGKYGTSSTVVSTENSSGGGGVNVEGDLIIQTDSSETGDDVLDKVETAARRRWKRGGEPNVGAENEF